MAGTIISKIQSKIILCPFFWCLQLWKCSATFFTWPMGETMWQKPLTHGGYDIVQHLDPWIVRHLLEYDFVHLSWVIHPLNNYHFSMTHGPYDIIRSMGHGQCIYPIAHGLYDTLIIIVFPWPMGHTMSYNPWVMDNLYPWRGGC